MAVVVALAFACLGTAGSVEAQDRHRASVPMKWTPVDRVDAERSEIVLGGQVYKVTPASRLRDADDQAISLDDVRGVDNDGFGDLVQIEARKVGRDGDSVIISLQIVHLGLP